jgi:HSP20 family protein
MTSYLPNVMSNGFEGQIDRLFDETLRALGASDRAWTPAANAWEDDNGFYVQLALPGWEQKDIAVEVNNQVLSVKGKRSDESSSSKKFYVQEIVNGQFARLFRLPTSVNQEKASATHKHGLLTIAFPKREEAKRRQIMIEGA